MNTSLSSIMETANARLSRNDLAISDFIEIPANSQIIRFAALKGRANILGSFDDSCVISVTESALQQIDKGQLHITIRAMNAANRVISGAVVHIGQQQGRLTVHFGSGGSVILGRLGSCVIDARIGHAGTLVIGDETTINGARIIAINSNILVGKDGLWSDEILVQGFDQHGIVDIRDRRLLNLYRKDVVIGPHVWVGRRATLMPGLEIGKGSIVGAGSIVTRPVPDFSAVAGNPARVVRSEVSWSRPWTHLDDATSRFLDENTGPETTTP